jgi:hypothetical protein
MRTKSLFLAAAISVAGLVSSMAQVYSVNVVGYVNVTVGPGFNLVANPLDAESNLVQDLMPDEFMTVWKFADGVYTSASFVGIWTGENFELPPGEGFWVQNNGTEAFTITFVGEITEGTKSNDIPQGFSIKSSIVPQEGTLSALEFPAAAGDQVFKWNNAISDYESANNVAGIWLPAEPSIGVGESFFVNKSAAVTWSRDFTVDGQ